MGVTSLTVKRGLYYQIAGRRTTGYLGCWHRISDQIWRNMVAD